MNKTDARQWLNRFADLPEELQHPCRHGHAQCSDTPGGECLDEVIKAAIPPVLPDEVPQS